MHFLQKPLEPINIEPNVMDSLEKMYIDNGHENHMDLETENGSVKNEDDMDNKELSNDGHKNGSLTFGNDNELKSPLKRKRSTSPSPDEPPNKKQRVDKYNNADIEKDIKKIDYKDENENGMEDGLIEDKIERNDEKMDIIDNSKKENDTKYSNMKDTNENKINSPSAKYDEKKNNFQKSKKQEIDKKYDRREDSVEGRGKNNTNNRSREKNSPERENRRSKERKNDNVKKKS